MGELPLRAEAEPLVKPGDIVAELAKAIVGNDGGGRLISTVEFLAEDTM